MGNIMDYDLEAMKKEQKAFEDYIEGIESAVSSMSKGVTDASDANTSKAVQKVCEQFTNSVEETLKLVRSINDTLTESVKLTSKLDVANGGAE